MLVQQFLCWAIVFWRRGTALSPEHTGQCSQPLTESTDQMLIGRPFLVMPLRQKPDIWPASVGLAAVHTGWMSACFCWTCWCRPIFHPWVQPLRSTQQSKISFHKSVLSKLLKANLWLAASLPLAIPPHSSFYSYWVSPVIFLHYVLLCYPLTDQVWWAINTKTLWC